MLAQSLQLQPLNPDLLTANIFYLAVILQIKAQRQVHRNMHYEDCVRSGVLPTWIWTHRLPPSNLNR